MTGVERLPGSRWCELMGTSIEMEVYDRLSVAELVDFCCGVEESHDTCSM